MARLVSPPRDQLNLLRTPLTAGEREVFELFDTMLPPEWEIYVQPHLNGLRPDFVLLNPEVGIAVFEVKDWDLDAIRYWHRRNATGYLELWATNRDGIDYRVRDDPIAKIQRYKDELLDLYCPRLGAKTRDTPNAIATITAGIIMTRASTARARALFDPLPGRNGLDARALRYHPIVGREALAARSIDQIFPEHGCRTSFYMSRTFADDLRSWLVEPDHAAVQREPLTLDRRQRELVTTRAPRGFRRIKGPAGSGKSVIVASRAAHLAMEGKDVLVTSYNITLLNYLRDLAVRYPAPGQGRTNRITWLHFHLWCKRVCYEAGMSSEYHSLFRDGVSETDQEHSVLEKDLPRLVSRALDHAGDQVATYDAILVDEGQDFNLEWWNVLRKVVRPDGEMLLVADEGQDIYERARSWTDEEMRGAGFSGRWRVLRGSYRLPESFVPLLRRYIHDYLPELSANAPEEVPLDTLRARQAELALETVKLRWVQTAPGLEAQAAVWALRGTFDLADPKQLSVSDITLLAPSQELGRDCVRLLEEAGIKSKHIFDTDPRRSRSQKLTFFMGDARIKACTIHSFKGWETRSLVVLLPYARSVKDRALLYVAMTRLKRHIDGSFLTVVCADPDLEPFGRTWSDFQYFRQTPNGRSASVAGRF